MDGNTQSLKDQPVTASWSPFVTDGGPMKMYLKPERVQIMLLLQALPGWQVLPNGRMIDRVRQFPSTELAMSYAAFSEKLARGVKLPISIHVADRVVLLALRSPSRHGRLEPLTERVLDLARQLG
jgi:hypothetical protein